MGVHPAPRISGKRRRIDPVESAGGGGSAETGIHALVGAHKRLFNKMVVHKQHLQVRFATSEKDNYA